MSDEEALYAIVRPDWFDFYGINVENLGPIQVQADRAWVMSSEEPDLTAFSMVQEDGIWKVGLEKNKALFTTFLESNMESMGQSQEGYLVALLEYISEVKVDPRLFYGPLKFNAAELPGFSLVANQRGINGLFDARWSGDGRVAATETGGVRLWQLGGEDGATWQEGHFLAASTENFIEGIAWSHDSLFIAGGNQDGAWLWDTASGEVVAQLETEQGALGFSWAPDDKRLVTSDHQGSLHIWSINHLDQPVLLAQLANEVKEVAWSPDGSHIAATMQNDLLMWDARTGRLVQTLKSHLDTVQRLAWSPDGSMIASSGADNTIRIWRLTGRLRHRIETLEIASSLAWSPDGKVLASGHEDGSIWLWDIPTGLYLINQPAHSSPIVDLGWSAVENRLLSSSVFEGSFIVWQVDE